MTEDLKLEDEDGEEVKLPGLPPNTKNYMTPACYRRLLDEREHLVNVGDRALSMLSVGRQAMVTVRKTGITNTESVVSARLTGASAS